MRVCVLIHTHTSHTLTHKVQGHIETLTYTQKQTRIGGTKPSWLQGEQPKNVFSHLTHGGGGYLVILSNPLMVNYTHYLD